MFFCNNTIPIVAIYVNCRLILFIKNGLYISKINNDNDILVHISFFRYIILDIRNKMLIILALTTDGLNPVNIMYTFKNNIVMILLYLFPNTLSTIKDIPYYNI